MPDSLALIPQPFFGHLVRALIWFLFRRCGGLTVIDAEHVPRHGPVLICPNHLSDCDPLAVYAALPRRDVYFLAKRELFDIPLLGPAIRAFGSVPIHRESADRAAIRRAVEILAQGSVLVLFPEGHLSESGRLSRLLPGIGMIAARAGQEIARAHSKPLTVVPVGLARTNRFLRYGSIVPRRSRLPARVRFGRPIRVDSADDATVKSPKVAVELIHAVESEIRRLTNQ